MKFIVVCFLFIIPVSYGLSGLLEMSQSLWSKLLNGGLSNIEPLDPLCVPIVKVDQSQGRTSYRMILTNIEIHGLNDSSLESIHVARGSVKSNLSDHEAGYVSYNDRNAIDFIRYRFHTVVKEPNNNQSQYESLKVLPLEISYNGDVNSRSNNDNLGTDKYEENSQRYSNSYDYSNRRYGNPQSKENQNQYYQDNQQQQQQRHHQQQQHHQSQDQHQYQYQHPQHHHVNPQQQQQQHQQNNQQKPYQYSQQHQQTNQPHHQQHKHQQDQYPQQHQQQYPQQHQQHDNQARRNQDNIFSNKESFGMPENKQIPDKDNIYNENNQRHHQIPQIEGFKSTSGYSKVRNLNNRNNNGNRDDTSHYLIYAQTQQNNGNSGGILRGNYGQISGGNNNADVPRYIDGHRMNGSVQIKYPSRFNGNNKPCADVENVEMLNRKVFGINENNYRGSSEKLENQPGYVDIIYADENSKKVRHFGNLRIEPRGDKTVYSLDDIMRDLENHRRFIIHNFTESESLLKRNDKFRTAEETKRIKDMVRYAKEFQEKQGYFEEGMELIYHYGNDSETKVYDGKRLKRAHEFENDNEDDIMHVIIKIHVPVLRVKAGYVLTGKVKDQVLRGNGQLIGNFTELIGEFTVELKKSNDNKTLTVRAARAKLEAKDQNIKLEGMDENDGVTEILNQGLMAAEAVAAMLADDLATKALSESTADAMIYRMYKELPTN